MSLIILRKLFVLWANFLASDIPKPMIKIEGIPVLEREIGCLKEQGFDDIIITVSHLGNIIMDYFGDGSGNSPVTRQPFGVHIEYYFENELLGNAGALFKIKDKLTAAGSAASRTIAFAGSHAAICASGTTGISTTRTAATASTRLSAGSCALIITTLTSTRTGTRTGTGTGTGAGTSASITASFASPCA